MSSATRRTRAAMAANIHDQVILDLLASTDASDDDGWGMYVDTSKAVGDQQTLTADSAATLANNKGTSTEQLGVDTSTFYSSGVIHLPRASQLYAVNVELIATPADVDAYLNISLVNNNIGAVVLATQTISLPIATAFNVMASFKIIPDATTVADGLIVTGLAKVENVTVYGCKITVETAQRLGSDPS